MRNMRCTSVTQVAYMRQYALVYTRCKKLVFGKGMIFTDPAKYFRAWYYGSEKCVVH